MKHLFALTIFALAVASPAAFAEDGQHKKGGHHLFEMADKDGDGAVSKAEFLAASEERFAKMDANGDGVFSKDEAEAAKAKWKEKMKEHREKRKEKTEAGE